MKMFLLGYSAAALCLVLFASGAVSAVEVKKAVGDAVSFSPASSIPPGADIIWKHRSDSGVVIKVIEYDEDGEKILSPRFNGITTLDTTTGEITIKDLTLVHSGVYTIDINSKEQEQKFTLTVKERVPKPVITPEKTANNPDVMYLRCEYSETIIWRNSDGETLKGSAISPIGESTTVRKEGKPEKFYTCSLKNDVSEETSEPVYERDLFKAVEVKKAVGDAVSFSPASAIPPGADIIWKHRSDSGVVIKVIEYDEDGENILNLNFQGITTLNETTGEITIKDLKPVHSGVYTIDINSKEQEQKFSLILMERVPKPVITPEKTANNPDVMYLRCEYSETIIWRNSDGETLNGSAINPIGESTTVHKEGKPEKFYTCSLKNDVSEETSEPVYERDLFKDELK